MAIYRYQPGSLLDEVTILSNEGGGLRAYLHAAPGSDSKQLRENKMALRNDNYVCIPTVHDGKPMLEVRGFLKEEELLSVLEKQGLVAGNAAITSAPGDDLTRRQKAKNHTLQLAGFSYNIGDTAYLYYKAVPTIKTWKTQSKGLFGERFFNVLDIIAGVGYGVGSICLSAFGARDQSINTITAATSKIERYARKEGYEISPESSIAYVNEKPDRTFWQKVSDTVARYPSEAMNSIYVGVGLCLSAASLYRATRKLDPHVLGDKYADAVKDKRADTIDVGLGVVTATSGIIGLAVKERKKLEGDPERSGFGGFIDWIREKPLRATGYGLMIATGFHAVSTYDKWQHSKRDERKFIIGRVIFIVTNILSEFLIAFSSKGHGVGVKPDNSVDTSIAATAAELISRQPEEKRAAMVDQLAGYIASPEVSAVKAEETAEFIKQGIAALDNNPWTAHYKEAHGKEPAAPKTDTPQAKVSSAEYQQAIALPEKQLAMAGA